MPRTIGVELFAHGRRSSPSFLFLFSCLVFVCLFFARGRHQEGERTCVMARLLLLPIVPAQAIPPTAISVCESRLSLACRQSCLSLIPVPVNPDCGAARAEVHRASNCLYHILIFWAKPSERVDSKAELLTGPAKTSLSLFGSAPKPAYQTSRSNHQCKNFLTSLLLPFSFSLSVNPRSLKVQFLLNNFIRNLLYMLKTPIDNVWKISAFCAVLSWLDAMFRPSKVNTDKLSLKCN